MIKEKWVRTQDVEIRRGKYVYASVYRNGTFEIIKAKNDIAWAVYDGEKHLGNAYTLQEAKLLVHLAKKTTIEE